VAGKAGRILTMVGGVVSGEEGGVERLGNLGKREGGVRGGRGREARGEGWTWGARGERAGVETAASRQRR